MENNTTKKPFKDFLKDYLISNIKESAKFAIVGTIVFLVMVIPLAHLLVIILKMETYVSVVIMSIITSVTIIYIDEKKIHAYKKILDNNREMAMRLLKR